MQEPLIDTIKYTSEKLTKIISEISNENNKAVSDLKEKVLDLMDDKGMIAPFLPSSLFSLFKPENKSQSRLKKDPNSSKMNDFLMNGGRPVNLHSNMLTSKDGNKSFQLEEFFQKK